jgi:hypothetical protein
MKIEAQFLLFLGVFFGIVGFVYWFTSYEDGGTMMLFAASLLGFFSGSYYMFWHRRMGKRVRTETTRPTPPAHLSLQADDERLAGIATRHLP